MLYTPRLRDEQVLGMALPASVDLPSEREEGDLRTQAGLPFSSPLALDFEATPQGRVVKEGSKQGNKERSKKGQSPMLQR